MRNEVIVSAKTVEEAMAQARAQYGTPENELSFEILAMPKKGFLGFGAAPAKIKVTITKALGDVNLSDIVSEIRSMKITTDRGGSDEEKTVPTAQPKVQQNASKAQSKPQQNGQKSQPKPQPKAQQDAPKSQPKPQPKAQQDAQKSQPKPQPKPQQDAQKSQPKPQPKPQQDAPKSQPKPQPKVQQDTLAEENLPAALRRPVRKPQQEKTKNTAHPSRPADNRPESEKKKELLSAVMGIQAHSSASASVAETAEKTEFATVSETTPAMPTADSFAGQAAGQESEKSVPESVRAGWDAPRTEFVTSEEMEYALEFANTLLANMHIPAKAEAAPAGEDVSVPEGMVWAKINITGDRTGLLIGHHGETLDAIQYLVNLSSSRRGGSGRKEFVKIVVDVENYRAKREETLRSLARRMAARAVKYKRNVVLEPMNPYERRIIHSELHDMENVSTHSVGSDENRKIVITYEGADKMPARRGGSGASSDTKRSRDGRRKRSARSASETEEIAVTYQREERRREKPVRAKSIDDVRIDISEASSATFGSIGLDEGVESEADPIAEIVRETEAGEENLREF